MIDSEWSDSRARSTVNHSGTEVQSVNLITFVHESAHFFFAGP